MSSSPGSGVITVEIVAAFDVYGQFLILWSIYSVALSNINVKFAARWRMLLRKTQRFFAWWKTIHRYEKRAGA
jgi:hypothetical protein